MDHQCIPQQALHWEGPHFRRGPGGQGHTWEEAEVAAVDRSEWHQRVAQYVSMDVG